MPLPDENPENVNERILNADIRNTAMYERFKAQLVNGHVRDLASEFEEIEDVLVVAFNRISKLTRGTRAYQKAITKFSRQIEDKVDSILAEQLEDLDTEFVDTAEVIDKSERKILDKALALTLIPLGLQARKKAVVNTDVRGLSLSARMDELASVTSGRLKSALGISLNNNEILSAARQRTKDELKKVNRNLEAVINTAATDLRSKVKLAVFGRAGIKRYLWVAVLDLRTTVICRSLDGEVFKVNKGPLPPQHFSCRSSIMPLIPGEAIPDSPTYEEWLRSQSVADQDQVLGQAKGKLFRENNLDLDIFVNRVGRPLTIIELEERIGLSDDT